MARFPSISSHQAGRWSKVELLLHVFPPTTTIRNAITAKSDAAKHSQELDQVDGHCITALGD